MTGFRLASESIKRISNKTFDKKFVILGRIISHWPDIVGKDIAANAVPVKLNYRKKGRGKSAEFKAILDIACSSAQAAKLQYRIDLIIEKLHHTIGRDLISGIRFVHLPANMQHTHTKKLRKRTKPLTSEQKNTLSHVLKNIEDEELHNKLKSLGTSMLEDSNR